MKVINPHSLITDEIKKITPSSDMVNLFNQWLELMNKKDNGASLFEGFIAGFFFGTNSSLRDKYKKLRMIENYDNRIENPLHIKKEI